nr:TetR family transcriptional regulator C-terminal domain-containing protein [Bacilli bacterium]
DTVIASFYIYGLIKIIDVWLTSGCKEPKEIILNNAKIAFDIISVGLLSKMN